MPRCCTLADQCVNMRKRTSSDTEVSQSRILFERASNVMTDGTSAPSRGPAAYTPHPQYIVRGKGAHIYDADGREYVDWSLAYGANILGHAHPAIVETVQRGVEEGVHFGAATPEEVSLAERVCDLCPSVEAVRFGPSGTEACMAAIRLARSYTGRDKIIKFEGHYHGWSDPTIVTADSHNPSSLGHPRSPVPIVDCSGVPHGAVADTIVVPWNDEAAIKRVMADRGREVACIITEGIMANLGVLLPYDGYLNLLQDLCKRHGALFYLDETVTGFRLAPSGCAELFGLNPDLVSYGKALGHGFPLAAVGGRRDVMEGLRYGKVMTGTFNACRLPAMAALAGLNVLSANNFAGFRKINACGRSVLEKISEIISAQSKHKVIVQGYGAIFQIMFTDQAEIRDYRQYCRHVDETKFNRFANLLRDEGVYINPVNSLKNSCSIAHNEDDEDLTVVGIGRALARLD